MLIVVGILFIYGGEDVNDILNKEDELTPYPFISLIQEIEELEDTI